MELLQNSCTSDAEKTALEPLVLILMKKQVGIGHELEAVRKSNKNLKKELDRGDRERGLLKKIFTEMAKELAALKRENQKMSQDLKIAENDARKLTQTVSQLQTLTKQLKGIEALLKILRWEK